MRRHLQRLACAVVAAALATALGAEESIRGAVRRFDEALLQAQSTTALVTLGFITYADTNTCGTVVPFMQREIQAACADSRRISIVKTTELSEYEQAGIATRGLTMGMSKKARTGGEKRYILDGTYRENAPYVELTLSMHDADGAVLAVHTARIAQSVLDAQQLTLYPQNKQLAQTIQADFDTVVTETEHEQDSPQQKPRERPIGIAASMLDAGGNLVNMLRANDIVRFKICADTDCYLAILCIDANGAKTWLPITDNFLEADRVRLFPDIAGAVLRVADDGVFGAEQVVIYACTDERGLPARQAGGKYASEDLHAIMRKQKLAREQANYGIGTFKITYTIMEH